MPPQEQADLWMALRDRMKANWAELTLQEKKAGTHTIYLLTSSTFTCDFLPNQLCSGIPTISKHPSGAPSITHSRFHALKLQPANVSSFVQHTTSPSAPTAPVLFLPQAKAGKSLHTRQSVLESPSLSSLRCVPLLVLLPLL